MTPATWVLILTMWGTTNQSGRSVIAIDFYTKSACEDAAKAWLDSRPTFTTNPPIGKGELAYAISGWHTATCTRKS